MTPNAEAVATAIDARIARARVLVAAQPATSALLDFYAGLAAWQRSLLRRVPEVVRVPAPQATPFAARLDVAAIAESVPHLLSWLGDHAPSALCQAVPVLAAASADAWQARITASLGEADEAVDEVAAAFVCEAVTQPFAEAVAMAMTPPASTRTPSAGEPARCPRCGGLPVAGVLRERGHGAHRALVCGRCLSEWAAPRVMCPACGGLDVEALPVFRAESWPGVRLDACEHCRTYLKSVDVSVDRHAIAVVDDLATLPLDLWAAEQGFHKGRPNLLRL
ncbi:MAG: formate dehydrogenase accessory protein FdhE [Acidobacteria bacterium]|nr:formate dehydrogenase accessory protein FdhE [Acidobacteriota bacterium]